jgi:hypothetical protein
LKKFLRILLISFVSLIVLVVLFVLVTQWLGIGNLSINLPVEHKDRYALPIDAAYPPALHASGNQLVDPSGNSVRLRGVMIPDPYRLARDGRFTRDLIAEIQPAGANIVRVPVHPENWQHDADYLWRYLDPLVTWAGDAGLYVIIDLHFIGNIATGAGDQMPDLDVPAAVFAQQFWLSVAPYFISAPHVLFEIYNEPANISAEAWITSNAELVSMIRSQGVTQPLLVGGVDYARDLSWVLEHPLNDTNLVYTSHIYPAHAKSRWGHWFGEVAQQYPVLITEWGFVDAQEVQGPDYLVGSVETYGEPFLTYLDEQNIGWVACWYDDEWLPPMFTDGFKSKTAYGQWVLDLLQP